MKHRMRFLRIVFPAIGMFVLILDSQTALNGAVQGIDLCIRTVIPSLFPFFVLSGMLTGTLLGISIPILRPVGKLCGIPEGAESLLIVGLLGGYPIGAQCITQAYHSGKLHKEDAHRMLGFCSNAGPAFLFGMAGLLFENDLYTWLLFSIQIFSAILVGMILPKTKSRSAIVLENTQFSLSQAVHKAIKAMASVCGWIVLFRVILTFCQRWFLWLLPQIGQAAFTGFCELSNGIFSLANIQSESVRFVLCAAMLSLGGVCVAMQTVSVTSGLGLGAYLPGKLLQCCISTVLASLVNVFLFSHSSYFISVAFITSLVCAALLIYKWGKREKNSSIPRLIRV